jgi:glycosyltransferase involved in cell wall biosynthesis
MTWDNFYSPGLENIGRTRVRRFPVGQPRDVAAFNGLSEQLHARRREASLFEQEHWMRAQGPVSEPLLDYLRTQKDSYDLFIFFGYLYATTYFGLPLVSDKALLAPLAHDEWTLDFSMWDRFFTLPQALIFNTATERDFLKRRFPGATLRGEVVGVGIEPPPSVDPEPFRVRYNLREPFLLYVGRVDESKGCGQMIDYFTRTARTTGPKRKLVLVGREVMPVPFHDDLISLGFLDDSEKWQAMAACEWLVLPSPYESLSMALLEGWSLKKPAIVNGDCAVLRAQCESANGGLWYCSFEEWSAILASINASTREKLGEQGFKYTMANYSWRRVEKSYRDLVHANNLVPNSFRS